MDRFQPSVTVGVFLSKQVKRAFTVNRLSIFSHSREFLKKWLESILYSHVKHACDIGPWHF